MYAALQNDKIPSDQLNGPSHCITLCAILSFRMTFACVSVLLCERCQCESNRCTNVCRYHNNHNVIKPHTPIRDMIAKRILPIANLSSERRVEIERGPSACYRPALSPHTHRTIAMQTQCHNLIIN